MKIKNIFITFLFTAFIGLNLFVRFYGLENSPTSLGFDEAGLGYNAYSLFLTGRDEWGYRLPLSLRSFNDYKPALYSYLAIPFIWAFDLSQATSRMPSAFWGTVSAIFTLLILKQLTKAKWPLVILAALFVCLSPWRLHFSRVALETNISASFFVITAWCLINRARNRLFKLGTILFGLLAIYSYHSARVAVPTLIFLAILDPLGRSLRRSFTDRKVIARDGLLLLAVLGLSLPIFLESGLSVMTRFNQTNLFSRFYPFTPTEILNGSNPWLSLTNHPLYYLGGQLFGRLAAYLSPLNLTMTFYPWVVKSAMVIIDNGMLGFLGAIFFIIGIFGVLPRFTKEPNVRVLFYWLLAGALPAALTWEWFHPFRSLNLFPALDIIAALGLLSILARVSSLKSIFPRATLLTCVLVFASISVLFNWLNEINYSPWENNGEFQPGGFKEGSAVLAPLIDRYPVIYIDTPQAQSYIFFALYGKFDPAIIQETDRQYRLADGFPSHVFDFGKFVYKKFSWPGEKNNHNFVYFTQSEIKEEEFKDVPGTTLYKVIDPFGRWTATIIAKD